MVCHDGYERIAARTGFAVPQVYRRMRTDGRLDYGATPEEWQATWRGRTLNDPPALLGADFEWWSLDDMADWTPPDYWTNAPALVPFAESGRADVWAWAPAWVEGGRAPIVFAARDVDEASLVAPDLEGLLFRLLVEWFSDLDPEAWDEFTPAERELALRAQVAAVSPYVRGSARRTLEELVARPLRTVELPKPFPKYRGPPLVCLQLLDADEARTLVERELAFSRLDETFKHMR
jgi:hypothetical protein